MMAQIVMFAHNRSGKGNDSRAYVCSVTHLGQHWGAKCDVYDSLVFTVRRYASTVYIHSGPVSVCTSVYLPEVGVLLKRLNTWVTQITLLAKFR